MMTKGIPFRANVNMGVRVKLTEFGINILKHRHYKLNKTIEQMGGEGLGEFELRLDSEGYYHTQLWILMSTFGHHMNLGGIEPFETDIIIENGETL